VLIIVGARRVRKHLGLAADFCPICRDYRAFDVAEMRQVPHLYYVPLGRGKTLASELECTRCRSVYAGGEAAYVAYAQSLTRDMAELARQTNPDIVSRSRVRLDAEDRLRAGRLKPQERAVLIAEPFAALDYMVRRRWGRGRFSGGAVAAVAAAVGLLVAALAMAASRHGRDAALVLGALVIPASAIAAVALLNGPRAWVRRHIQPRLVAALLPLDPSAEELAAALEGVRPGSAAIASRVEAGALLAALERARGGREASGARQGLGDRDAEDQR
jgi:hypothetical protein